MSIVSLLKNISVKLEKNNNPMFSVPVKKQVKFLECIDLPMDDIGRSYSQYKCQKYLSSKIVNMLSWLASPILYASLKRRYTKTKVDFVEKKDAVFFADGKPENIIPNSLKSDLRNIVTIREDGFSLVESDLGFLKSIKKRYPYAFEFHLKMLIKIAKYRYACEKYHPDTIIVCAEYSFTSSALTAWCKNEKINHYNVQHGEHVFYIRDAFFHFDKCYIWNEHYKKMFSDLRVPTEQFIIEIPQSLLFSDDVNPDIVVDYTYYLAMEKEEELIRISEFLKRISESGNKRIAVRPHPRYSNLELVRTLFSGFEIEEPSLLPIEISIKRTRNVMAVYSTVLNQANTNNIPIVIDDVSSPEKYKKLEEIRYIFAGKSIMTVSDLLKEL